MLQYQILSINVSVYIIETKHEPLFSHEIYLQNPNMTSMAALVHLSLVDFVERIWVFLCNGHHITVNCRNAIT